MKPLLPRLAEAWRNLPQSTKLLLAGLLLVSAVALWYVGFYLPAQATMEVQPTPGQPQVPSQGGEAPKAIEAPPIPPLAETPPPGQAAKPSPEASPSQGAPKAGKPVLTPALPIPKTQQEAPLPNPFVPLVVEAPPAPPVPSPAPAPRPTPVPTGAPVRVTQGTPLPTPSVQTPPRPLPGSQGALPAPKVLTPAFQVETPKAQVETPPVLTPPAGLVEAPLPRAPQTPEGGKTEPAPSPKTPLQALVGEKGIKLAGTLLGPVSVAILETKEGYLVLPVGSLLPGSEAVLRRIESDRVVLALKDESLEITLENTQAGGGQ
ncbi:competence protein [Thermus tenuipuniceus]|uniref:competence protein n=1 Tax=Thermus tenuipuniceus TaxID=2078690 RepID=UPI000CF9C316|nr:competence protein [Thermus tenuipuniceus]